MSLHDRSQSQQKIENQRRVLEYFDKHGGTIEEIANALGLKRSTVQRYLSDIQDPDKLKIIKTYLAANKEEGNKRGGKISQEKHGYEKGDLGRFSGSGRRK